MPIQIIAWRIQRRTLLALLIFGTTLSSVITGRTESTSLDPTNKTTNIRPYIQLRSGEFDTVWGVQDEWGVGIGADLSRHVGLELSFDSYEKNFEPFSQKLGEESLITLVPQVRLRLPLANDRIVPYVIAGAGIGWYDFNDPVSAGYGDDIDAQGTQLVISGGIGIDLFINETIAFNLEGKYLWTDELDISVNGAPGKFDMADFMCTFGFRAYMDREPELALADSQEHVPLRLYFGAGWGGAQILDGDWVPGVSLGHETSSIGSIGQSVELNLGLNIARHFGVELTADYWEGNIILDNVNGVTGGVGEYAVYTVMPNFRFRWPLQDGRFVPYLTAGVGATYGEVNDRFDNGTGTSVDAKGFSPACSIGAGAEYFFNRNVSLFAQTKWLYSWDRAIDVNHTGDQTGDNSWLYFQLGFRLYLLDIGGDN